MITITNKNKGGQGIYIGRGSVLGNPFSYLPKTKAAYKVANRKEAIEHYESWICWQILSNNATILDELRLIQNRYRNEDDICLQCYCAPKECHGEVIKRLIECGDFYAYASEFVHDPNETTARTHASTLFLS